MSGGGPGSGAQAWRSHLLDGLTFAPREDPGDAAGLEGWLRGAAGAAGPQVGRPAILRRSLDARRKGRPAFRYTLLVDLGPAAAAALTRALPRAGQPAPVPAEVPEPSLAPPPAPLLLRRPPPPVAVVGSGPAGLFAALQLAEAGVPVTIFERGEPVEERTRRVEAHRGGGELDPESNIQFGEGGAGTFSDGKLYSGIRDARRQRVLETLAALGAPPDILYEARPHVGTDLLRDVVRAFRRRLEALGCAYRFRCRVDSFLLAGDGRLAGLRLAAGGEFPCRQAVLAPGHSARDTFRMLAGLGVRLLFKPFAAGLRVEHPQELVDRIQYGPRGRSAGLPPAEYRVAVRTASGRPVYSFCMCPGGEVVAAASGRGEAVTNGMSLRARDGRWANAGIVAAVDAAQLGAGGEPEPLAGVRWQEDLERLAFGLGGGGGRAPAQRVASFLAGKEDAALPPSSFRPGVQAARLEACFDPRTAADLREGLSLIDRWLRGFAGAEALLLGVETRTSSPVRILREEGGEAVGLPGLYPAGEGSGYAGGIVSSAVDGLRAAEALLARLG